MRHFTLRGVSFHQVSNVVLYNVMKMNLVSL